MSQDTSQCDPRLLEDLLCGTIDDDRSDRLMQHLDRCEQCRLSLDAGSAVFDQETSKLLRPQPFDVDSDRNEPSDGDVSVLVERESEPTEPPEQTFAMRSVIESLAPTDDPEMLGRLGAYEVSGVVGAGGMGVVLKAFDKSLDRSVAIKVMSPHVACSGAARKRFEREAKAAAAVLHPNVIAIHGVSGGESTSLPYLVMPYLRGSSLQARIDHHGPMEVTEILRVASQIVEGLVAAHAQGLVHRDIKPANILLEDGVERVSITDFGLARAVDDATLTHSGVISGTPQYMSPEQARGDAVDARSDLFSLGSVIYTMCTGRPPFRADSSFGILRRICERRARPIREINPTIPTWLCRLVDRLHAKSPDDRYQNAADVAEVLQQCLAHVQTPDANLPPELLQPSWLVSAIRRPIMWVGMAAAIALVAAVWVSTSGLFTQGQVSSNPPDSPGEATATAESHPVDQERGEIELDKNGPLKNGPLKNEPALDNRPADLPTSTPDWSWEDSDEPSLESVWVLIDALDRETRSSFDESSDEDKPTQPVVPQL